MTSLADNLETYLSRLWEAPVAVADLSRIPGWGRRETYQFDAVADGQTRGLILRREPAASLIDTDRRLELLAYRSFHGRGVPVPEPVALEEEGAELERPFFIMGRVEGGKAASPFTVTPYGEHAAALGQQFFTILGAIHAVDPVGLPLTEVAETPVPDDCWRRELDYWEGVIDADEQHPQPIVRAAIRALRRRPPPPAQAVRVIHGDYRSGNFLHGDGRIIAILDWEMAHLGDPLEDLGWAIDPLWGHFEAGRVGGMLDRADAIAIWERASGLKAEPEALAWWELFSAVKGMGIWISAAKAFRDGGFKDPMLGISGWYTARRHDQIIARRLATLGGLA